MGEVLALVANARHRGKMFKAAIEIFQQPVRGAETVFGTLLSKTGQGCDVVC